MTEDAVERARQFEAIAKQAHDDALHDWNTEGNDADLDECIIRHVATALAAAAVDARRAALEDAALNPSDAVVEAACKATGLTTAHSHKRMRVALKAAGECALAALPPAPETPHKIDPNWNEAEDTRRFDENLEAQLDQFEKAFPSAPETQEG